MFEPKSYSVQLLLMVLSMICWGSWANTIKLTPGWRFQAFYWDYVVGVFLGAIVWGTALGGGAGFFTELMRLATHPFGAIISAVLAGIIFNAANQLLVAAIELAGLAVAFPIGIGLALVIGVVLNYVLAPASNPKFLFVGVALVVAAIVVDSVAYKKRAASNAELSRVGILLSLLCGVLMGMFYPFLTRAMQGKHALDAYTVTPFFAIGVALCALPMNTWFMKHPAKGDPVALLEYTEAKPAWHLFGWLGGFIWCTGLSMNLISSRAQSVGPAVSYALGQGATMISALWGVCVWHEFRGAPKIVNYLIPIMFCLFILGLWLIALAPTR